MSRKIRKIRTGGQSGVDRAALDVARELNIEICGWCPQGGWAEDYTTPPGLLSDYPELTETPSAGTTQRTLWNMRDAKAVIHWLDSLPDELDLSICDPRASECPNAYEVTRMLMRVVLSKIR